MGIYCDILRHSLLMSSPMEVFDRHPLPTKDKRDLYRRDVAVVEALRELVYKMAEPNPFLREQVYSTVF